MKRNILFIINGITKNGNKISVSGGDVRLFEIIKRLDKRKFQVYTMTTQNGLFLLDKYKVPYDKIILLRYNASSGFISNLLVSFFAFIEPKTLFFKYEYVYSSCEHLYDVLPAFKLKVFKRAKKWLAVNHWVEGPPWKEKRGGTPLIKRYIYWLNRVLSEFLIKHFSDRILAVSESTAKKLIKIKRVKKKKIQIVYCGVNYKEINKILLKYKAEKGKSYDALFMKRLDYGKGVLDLLKIWNNVVMKKKKAKLAIVGGGADSVIKTMKKYIKEHHLEKNVKMLGVIYDFEKKFRLINSSKLFVLPSHEENWAIAIGEAMAIKVPVIAYKLKEIVPIWKDNVIWVPRGDITSFSDKIISLLEDDKKRHQIAEKSHKFIKRYDWDIIAKNELEKVKI